MKFVLLFMLLFVSCGKDSVEIINNSKRVSDLERRMTLNEQLDSIQDQRLYILENSVNALEDRLADFESEVEQQILDLDSNINANAAAQSIVNAIVQAQLAYIYGRLLFLGGRAVSLQNQINNSNSNLSSLQNQINTLGANMNILSTNINTTIDALQAAQIATQAQLDQEGVKVLKCDSPSSTERILKINNKFYAVMNRVAKETHPILAPDVDIQIAQPDVCVHKTDGTIKMPNSGGQCTPANEWDKVEGITQTVPSYSSQDVDMVVGVKIALEILPIGDYTTTDGSTACNFSITNTGSTNLIEAQ